MNKDTNIVQKLEKKLAKMLEYYPTSWTRQSDYIPTIEHPGLDINLVARGYSNSDGIEYTVLDDQTIAWREVGDYRITGDWKLSSPQEFADAVIKDAKNFLHQMQEKAKRLGLA